MKSSIIAPLDQRVGRISQNIGQNRRRSIFGDILQKEKNGKSRIVTKTHIEHPLSSTRRRGMHHCNIQGILRRDKQNPSMLQNLDSHEDQRIKGGKRVQFKPQILMHVYFSASIMEFFDENRYPEI